MWMPFLTQDINLHFCVLFIAKFELFKLHSKVCSFERMFKFNQVCLGPNRCMYIVMQVIIHSVTFSLLQFLLSSLNFLICSDFMMS